MGDEISGSSTALHYNEVLYIGVVYEKNLLFGQIE